MSRSIANTSSPSQIVGGEIETGACGGMVFGWRPPASCYGNGSKTPQQVDRPQCGGGHFLALLVGAAVLGLAVRRS